MRKLIGVMALMAVLGLLAMPAGADQVTKDRVLMRAEIRTDQGDPYLCLVLEENAGRCDSVDLAKAISMVAVDRHRDGTYVKIRFIIGQTGFIAHRQPEAIIVRSEAVKQEWLRRLKAVRPPKDVLPTIVK